MFPETRLFKADVVHETNITSDVLTIIGYVLGFALCVYIVEKRSNTRIAKQSKPTTTSTTSENNCDWIPQRETILARDENPDNKLDSKELDDNERW